MAGVNLGYTMVPNPIAGRMDLVKCLLCQTGEENPSLFVQISTFARHCDTQHPDWENYAASGFEKCNVCRNLFKGRAGLLAHRRHNQVCAAGAPAPQAGVAAGIIGGNEEAVQGAEERVYTEHELMAPFGDALYHIHKEWEEPFWYICVSLLRGMVPGDHCYAATLGFLLLPGIMAFLRNHSDLGRVVDFVRRLRALDTPIAIAEAIKLEAVRLIQCKASGECPPRPKKMGVDGALKSVGTLVRGGRLSAGARILDSIKPNANSTMSLSNSMVLELTLEQRKAEVEKLHPRFRSEELDGLRSSDGGPIVMNAEPVGIVLDVADILQGIKLLSTD